MFCEAEAAVLNSATEAAVHNVADTALADNSFYMLERPQFLEAAAASHLRTHFQTAGNEVLQALQQPLSDSYDFLLDEAQQLPEVCFSDFGLRCEYESQLMSSMQEANSPTWDFEHQCMEAPSSMPLDNNSFMTNDADYCVTDL